MKNTLKKFLIILLLIPCMLFVACAGQSAYDIAVKNGFIGTEKEWLESLKGEDGSDRVLQSLYTDAVAKGEFAGTYLEFINEYILKYNSNSVMYSVNRNLLSSVSIYSRFTIYSLVEGLYGQFTQTPEYYYSSGSGVILDMDSEGNAYIMTNYHVVYDIQSHDENHIASQISVFLYGSESQEYQIYAKYIGGSMTYDIAVLKIENSYILKESNARPVVVGDSTKVSVGQTAIAIGNANSQGISATSGIVSVDNETIQMYGADGQTVVNFRVMRIDTPVNSGNSGGGLFDDCGYLIGIVNAKIKSTEVENIGYAIPSNIAVGVARNLINGYEKDNENRVVQKTFLGITIQAISSNAIFNEETQLVKVVQTIKVIAVSETSLAYGSVQVNDIIIGATVNGVYKKLDRFYELPDLLLTTQVGDTVSLVVSREDTLYTYSFVLTQQSVSPIE